MAVYPGRPSSKPRPAEGEFHNPVAYRLADILWRCGGLADVLTPEEMFWLEQAPTAIEQLQKLASDAIAMVPTPRFVL